MVINTTKGLFRYTRLPISSAPGIFQREMEQRLSDTGLRVKQSKCLFMVPTLGHRIDAKSLHPLADKVKAIEAPTNITELKSCLGLLTYYGKFLPNLADKLTPLLPPWLLGILLLWKPDRELTDINFHFTVN